MRGPLWLRRVAAWGHSACAPVGAAGGLSIAALSTPAVGAGSPDGARPAGVAVSLARVAGRSTSPPGDTPPAGPAAGSGPSGSPSNDAASTGWPAPLAAAAPPFRDRVARQLQPLFLAHEIDKFEHQRPWYLIGSALGCSAGQPLVVCP